jgi:hypothetical protein
MTQTMERTIAAIRAGSDGSGLPAATALPLLLLLSPLDGESCPLTHFVAGERRSTFISLSDLAAFLPRDGGRSAWKQLRVRLVEEVLVLAAITEDGDPLGQSLA